jgi:hypothetical protein
LSEERTAKLGFFDEGIFGFGGNRKERANSATTKNKKYLTSGEEVFKGRL